MADLNQKEAAERIGKSASWVRELTKRGVLHRNSDGKYDSDRLESEYEAFKQVDEEKRDRGFGDERYEVARARKVAAQARLAELEVLVREGELISIGAHRAVCDKMIELFRASLLAVPGSWGPRVVGIKSPAEGKEAMRICSEELLRDLASASGQIRTQEPAT